MVNWARIVPIGVGAVVVLVLLYYGVTRGWQAITPNPAYARVITAVEKYNELPSTKKKIRADAVGSGEHYFRFIIPSELMSSEERAFWKEKAIPEVDKELGPGVAVIEDIHEVRVDGDRQSIHYVMVSCSGKWKDKNRFEVTLEYEETRDSTGVWLGGWADFFTSKAKKETPPAPKMPPPPKKLKGLPPPPK